MVVLVPIPRDVSREVAKNIMPLLPLLHDFTEIQKEPKILCLRNPNLRSDLYAAWQKDHRYGRRTCPGPDDPCWPASVGKVVETLGGDSGLTCISAMVIHYSHPGSSASYHKDPPVYERIASLTLEGVGIMKVKRGGVLVQSYELVPGVGVVLESDDCWFAKHGVTSSDRLGLVLRYADVSTHSVI